MGRNRMTLAILYADLENADLFQSKVLENPLAIDILPSESSEDEVKGIAEK